MHNIYMSSYTSSTQDAEGHADPYAVIDER